MKTIKLLLIAISSIFVFQSCTVDIHEDHYQEPTISLPQLMESYELWYIDYNRTTGTGDVPFLSRAFTISFSNGHLYANNNLVGIGNTGNGFGIAIGTYDYNSNSIDVYHNIYGYYNLEVYQISHNEIKVYNRATNTTYFLIGFQRNNFDYDWVFYENIHYFLQEYGAWENVSTTGGTPNVFDNENYLRFLAGGSDDTFQSSQDQNISNIDMIYWDYTGRYEVQNMSGNPNSKMLKLYYNNNDFESFVLNIVNDGRIRLYHQSSGTVYEYVGRGFIPYLRQDIKRTKSK